ncbi:MAG: SDR family NAD(P)-dependent oxidoreductase [Actinobacteria bacterium]|jgi:NADP-dependent 3-hydroxy acid dehydrogenase YdfG|nr:SDR family NAD(P)-dependent oxidoreductase [Actinomycetota bacterium]MCL6095501.1 SDR family NAD(P)-dependent oxidoreductase [Actinomycetota bacterium]
MLSTETAVITGASSGIGEATAHALANAGYKVILGARRVDRLEKVARATGGQAFALDVTDQRSVDDFVNQVPEVSILVNNAGGALGMESIQEADLGKWLTMYESNVLGTVRMTKALLPKLESSGNGHIVMVTSIASFMPYIGGGGYVAAKHAERALTATLRLELLGKPIRVTDIAPGMVQTEFSLVRFGGDRVKADAVYEGMLPLTAEDIADCILWSVTRPPHVNIDKIVVMPRDQAAPGVVHRRPSSSGHDS